MIKLIIGFFMSFLLLFPINASFSVEANPNPNYLNSGFFMSGVLGMEKVEDFILLEGTANGTDQDGYYLQQETNDLLVTNLIPPY